MLEYESPTGQLHPDPKSGVTEVRISMPYEEYRSLVTGIMVGANGDRIIENLTALYPQINGDEIGREVGILSLEERGPVRIRPTNPEFEYYNLHFEARGFDGTCYGDVFAKDPLPDDVIDLVADYNKKERVPKSPQERLALGLALDCDDLRCLGAITEKLDATLWLAIITLTREQHEKIKITKTKLPTDLLTLLGIDKVS